MANPSKRDRRAVVEQMRQEQRRAEKRRTFAVLAVCAVVALAIVGMALVPVLRQHDANAAELDTLGVSAAAAGCRDIVTKPANGNNQHRPPGTRIVYPDSPPAFGPHYPTPAPMGRKFYAAQDRPALEYLVHNLEHGYTILWYDSSVARDADQLSTVRAIAKTFSGTAMRDKFIAAPWTGADGEPFPDGAHVALTHWSMGGDPQGRNQQGVWDYCSKPSGEVVAGFVKKYPYTDSPEPAAM